jgi:hypothetical protein
MSADTKEPAEFAIGDRVRTNALAPREYRRRDGTVTEIGPGASEFRVEFEDGRRPTTAYLLASCLDKAS